MNYRFAFSVLGFLRDTTFSETTDPYVQPFSASEFDRAACHPGGLPARGVWYGHESAEQPRTSTVLCVCWTTTQSTTPQAHPLTTLRMAAHAWRWPPCSSLRCPGAPTIFYGDEVGLVGFGSDPLRDDPHNRQPYPWEDEAGYDTLPAWRQADGDLLALYQQLGALRNAAAPVLRRVANAADGRRRHLCLPAQR